VFAVDLVEDALPGCELGEVEVAAEVHFQRDRALVGACDVPQLRPISGSSRAASKVRLVTWLQPGMAVPRISWPVSRWAGFTTISVPVPRTTGSIRPVARPMAPMRLPCR
jgi:hypothetical protein